MSIDERLERLTERHEALTQTVEILTHDVAATNLGIDRLMNVVTQLTQLARQREERITRLESDQ